MTGGLDRLEKFFSSSWKKEKDVQQRSLPLRDFDSVKTTSPGTDARETTVFPSPSFLKPTSSRMQPRDEAQNGKDKARSRSLPDVKKSIRGQLAGITSLDVERKTRSYEPRPQSIPELPSTPHLSVFRFPEDSLFRSPKTPDTSKSSPRHTNTSHAPLEAPKPEKDGQQLLDWSPQRISLMFKPNEFQLSMNEKVGLDLVHYSQDEKALMPSPMFNVPEHPPPKSPLRRKALKTPPRPHTGQPTKSQPWDFSKFPRQYSVINTSVCHTYSPPTSDSEDDRSTIVAIGANLHKKSNSETRPNIESSPKSMVTEAPPISASGHKTSRETWGVRHDDPKLQYPNSNGSPVPRLPLREIDNAPNLPVASFAFMGEVGEPTIKDIYALSDDDIFEARPFTPPPSYPPPPPPPPPKDEVRVRVRRRTLTPAIVQPRRVHAVDPTSGEMTPPETPVELQFLAPLPARHSATELGAIMTAGLATKYNFDLIYLVKVWPKRESRYRSTSLRVASGGGSPHGSADFERALCSTSGAVLSGQYLAAFGLDQVGEPLQIQTHVLQEALQSNSWNEIDDPAGPFSHGWACSLASKRASVRSQEVERKSLVAKNPNRGIVFAAYSRRHNNTVLPRESPSTTKFLAELRDDAEKLAKLVLGDH